MHLDALALIFAVLTLADIASTSYALRRGLAREANPLMRVLMDALGRDVTLALKSVFAGCVWIFRADVGQSMMIVVDVLMAAVVAWNIKTIMGAR